MKLLLIVCARSSIIDARRNSVSIIDILDQVISPSFPVIIPNMTLLAVFEKQPSENIPEIRLKITLDSVELADGPFVIDFGTHELTRGFGEISGIVIEKPGTLKFTLVSKHGEMGAWPVRIKGLNPKIESSPNDAAQKNNRPTKRLRQRIKRK